MLERRKKDEENAAASKTAARTSVNASTTSATGNSDGNKNVVSDVLGMESFSFGSSEDSSQSPIGESMGSEFEESVPEEVASDGEESDWL